MSEYDAPPPFPWERGKHATHEVITVELMVCRDVHGRVYSSHALQGEQDREIAMSWPTGGQEQVGFALLTEATRRESILSLLVLLTKDRDLVKRLMDLPPERLQAEVTQMGQNVSTTMRRTIDAIAGGSFRDALSMVAEGSTRDSG